MKTKAAVYDELVLNYGKRFADAAVVDLERGVKAKELTWDEANGIAANVVGASGSGIDMFVHEGKAAQAGRIVTAIIDAALVSPDRAPAVVRQYVELLDEPPFWQDGDYSDDEWIAQALESMHDWAQEASLDFAALRAQLTPLRAKRRDYRGSHFDVFAKDVAALRRATSVLGYDRDAMVALATAQKSSFAAILVLSETYGFTVVEVADALTRIEQCRVWADPVTVFETCAKQGVRAHQSAMAMVRIVTDPPDFPSPTYNVVSRSELMWRQMQWCEDKQLPLRTDEQAYWGTIVGYEVNGLDMNTYGPELLLRLLYTGSQTALGQQLGMFGVLKLYRQYLIDVYETHAAHGELTDLDYAFRLALQKAAETLGLTDFPKP